MSVNQRFSAFTNCRLCPRSCGVDRTRSSGRAGAGACGETHLLRIAYIGPHFGEEPPIAGENGSGTVFLSGCSLRCSFCQNHQISHEGLGRVMSVEGAVEEIEEMIDSTGAHNVNFVSPDHFFPHVFRIVSRLREKGLDLPVVFNLSGYQSLEALDSAAPYADVYLPDFKYSDGALASKLSGCRDYPQRALDAVAKMTRQKGFLDLPQTGTAKKGVLVRHLVLPGQVKNSIDALSALFVEFGSGLPLSLMSQYRPVAPQRDEALNRRLLPGEFDRVYAHALELGFESLFVQFPDASGESPFLPDFRRKKPFGG